MYSISNVLNDDGEQVAVIFHDGRRIGTIEGGPAYPGDDRPSYVARGHEVRAVRDDRDVIGETVYAASIASSRATVERVPHAADEYDQQGDLPPMHPTTCRDCGHYLPTGTHGDDECQPEPAAERGRP